MPIYNDILDDGFIPRRTPLMSSIGIGPKVTDAIVGATKEWLDDHPEATIAVEDGSITSAKLAENAVTSSKLASNTVTRDKMSDRSVGNNELVDESVTMSKLANRSVSTDKLEDGSVTNEKIVNGSITRNKLANDVIPTMSSTVKGIAKVGSGLVVNDEVLELDGGGDIEGAVQSWLDEHPEATTTVEDNSITMAKLNSDVKSGLYYDNDFQDEQAFPLTLGTITYRGVTVTVSPNGIVDIHGTASGNGRFRLNDGLAYSASIAGLLQSEHAMDTGWYVINTKFISGTYACDTTGDRGGMYFYFNDDSEEYAATLKVYATDHGWNFNYPMSPPAKNYHLTNVVFLMKSGEVFDCRIKIDIHKVNANDHARQRDIIRRGEYIQNSLIDAQYWVLGTVSQHTADGLGGKITRLAFEKPVRFKTGVSVAITDPTYSVSVVSYNNGDMVHWSSYYGWSNSSDVRVIPAGLFVRILLMKTDDSTFTVEEYEEVLQKVVVYANNTLDESLSIASRNPDAISNLSVMTRGRSNTIVVAHITDTHSDGIRWGNFLKAVDEIQPDVVVHTGDVVKADMRDDYSYLVQNLPSIPMVLALGNHDVGTGRDVNHGGIDTAGAVSVWVDPINDKYGWDNEHPYYYYDTTKVRFIVLYPYDYDEGIDGVFVDRVGVYYTQAQIDWLVSTLQDAKSNGLAVVIAAHEPDKVLPYDQGFGKFHSLSNYSEHSYKRTSDAPICDIVEAFIHGESINRTYIQANDLAPNVSSITVDATFTGTGNFVCWLTGHLHGDYYGWIPNTSQLLIREAAGCVGISTPYSTVNSAKDLGQILGTKTEDCFNFYAIKPASHTIGIVRFGADTTYDFNKRDYMVQDYLDYNTGE